MTVNCALLGGSSATGAVCTGQSASANLTQTTTLNSSQISYVPVTVTAGATKLASIASQATGSASSGSSGSAKATGSSTATGGSASASATAKSGAESMAVAGGLAGYVLLGLAAVALL